MTGRCETCVNRRVHKKSGDAFYVCEELPRLLEMHHKRWIRVGEGFGCPGHTPKVEVPEIETCGGWIEVCCRHTLAGHIWPTWSDVAMLPR